LFGKPGGPRVAAKPDARLSRKGVRRVEYRSKRRDFTLSRAFTTSADAFAAARQRRRQRHQPQLERALESAGLKTADNGLQFTLRDQSFAGQNGQGGSQANTATIVIPDADQPATPATQIYSRFARVSGIDIRV